MVNLTIDHIPVTVPEGTTILDAARSAGIHIPACVISGGSMRSAPAGCAWWNWAAWTGWCPPVTMW